MPDDPHALIAVCFLANVALAGVLWATISRVAGLERRELKRIQKEAASNEQRPQSGGATWSQQVKGAEGGRVL